MTKEPDYMFVVKRSRKDVLTDQLDAINDKYAEKRLDPKDPEYGLLDGERKYLDYKIYKKSGEEEKPENQRLSLVLVHFSDRILNYKAEELEMMVHL